MKLTGLAAAQPSLLATRRGKLILVLLCSVAFLDFVDTAQMADAYASAAAASR